MADTKEKAGFFARVWAAICGFFANIGKSFTNMWHELKKVTWPTKDKLIRYSAIVVLFILFMMVVIGVLDWGASELIGLIAKI